MATFIPKPGESAQLARDLLAAAGGDVSKVRIVTTGPSPAFDVDDDVADAMTKPAAPRKPRRRSNSQDQEDQL